MQVSFRAASMLRTNCRQTRSNSVLSGGVGPHGSYRSIKLLRSELRVRKDTELSPENVLNSIACFQQCARPHIH